MKTDEELIQNHYDWTEPLDEDLTMLLSDCKILMAKAREETLKDVKVKLVFLMSKHFQSTSDNTFLPMTNKDMFCIDMYDYIKSLSKPNSPQTTPKLNGVDSLSTSCCRDKTADSLRDKSLNENHHD